MTLRDFGILPFWFLNGSLDEDEMRWQLRELREKGMAGVILHGRYGLETPYLGETYLDRIALAVAEAAELGLQAWIYDEMNWPSGTADQRVLRARPDLAQRYLQCVELTVSGPWFACLTGEDSRYLDFERSTPVAAFAISSAGEVMDLTPNLSFEKVLPWQVPPGDWRLLHIVEKRADYYIDALNPEATTEFLRIGYEPYAARLNGGVAGFYTDEPAMHYFLSAQDVPIVPWTKDMFRRFRERNGYDLRPRLPHLFADLGGDGAQVRFDFYETLTAFYGDAYYRQIHDWCRARGAAFTGHLLYEEWLRPMIRAEGNPFRHYEHFDVVGVDHLYPVIGDRDDPSQHVAIKLASSAAHQLGSERLLCESFGGLFMDATMQRMKWIADWQYVLGVNLLNPHGFHYTLEGPRKRDWPPSMFHQYPWWRHYGAFSEYVSRLSRALSGGRHVAKVAVLWPMTSMFANYLPQRRDPHSERTERDFGVLTDLLLRLHHDFDYLDEEVLARGEVTGGALRVGDEEHELVILPPITHIKLAALEQLERLVAAGGRLLGLVFLPDRAFGPHGVIDVADRVQALFGVDPRRTQREYAEQDDVALVGGGATAFLRAGRLERGVDGARAERAGYFEASRHLLDGADVSERVAAERSVVRDVLRDALHALVEPDVVVDNDELFVLHRVKDGRDRYFLVNPTGAPQAAAVSVPGEIQPLLIDPMTGRERPVVPSRLAGGRTHFDIALEPVGSALVAGGTDGGWRIYDADVAVDELADGRILARGRRGEATVVVERGRSRECLTALAPPAPEPVVIEGPWEFAAEDGNALVIRDLVATRETAPGDSAYAAVDADPSSWTRVVPGAWGFQQPEAVDDGPLAVWYRAGFEVADVPSSLDLLIDGFAGADRRVYVNGRAIDVVARRSSVDSQMQVVDISGAVEEGTNVIAVRLTLRQATDGLLDPVKLVGSFALAGGVVSAPRSAAECGDWTQQGHPFYSGVGVYRARFGVSAEIAGALVVLQADAGDDVLEVVVNGRPAGVRLWPPYELEIGDLLRAGENALELRVFNTPVNLLEGRPRRSGLTGPPRLVPYNRFEVRLPS